MERHKSESIYYDARASFEAGRFQEAIDLLEQSLLYAKHYKAYELLGVSLGKIGHTKEALAAFENAYNINSNSAKTACLFAESLIACNDIKRAAAILSGVLENNPTYGPANQLLSRTQINEH